MKIGNILYAALLVFGLTVAGCGKKTEPQSPATTAAPVSPGAAAPGATAAGIPPPQNAGQAIESNPNLSPAQKQAEFTKMYQRQAAGGH